MGRLEERSTLPTPYGDHAMTYLRAGYFPLPLPAGSKYPPPTGWTGEAGDYPSGADVQSWIDEPPASRYGPASNIGLRLAADMIGIDVDHYADKHGGDILQLLEAQHGPLPATPYCTSRGPGRSGVRLFRIPEGVRLVASLPGGIDIIQKHHRYVCAPPSIHPSGNPYEWITPDGERSPMGFPSIDDVPFLPDAWLDALAEDKHKASDQSTGTRSDGAALLAAALADDANLCGKFSAYLPEALERVSTAKHGSRHDGAVKVAPTLLRLHDQGHEGAGTILRDVGKAFIDAIAPDRAGGAREAESEWANALTYAANTIAADPTPEADRRCCLQALAAQAPSRDVSLEDVIASLRRHADLPDIGHVLAVLATAATSQGEGKPAWLLLVSPASSGKTEAVHLLSQIADRTLDDVSAAGLLSWTTGKSPRKRGVLTRIPSVALVTIADLSHFLASSDRGMKDQVFSTFRSMYDGAVRRDLGLGAEGDELAWQGRITLVGAVTNAIDNYTSHNDQLGPRWTYYRISERSTEDKRRAVSIATRIDLGPLRDESARLAADLVRHAQRRLASVQIDEDMHLEIMDAALTGAAGRGSVPRNHRNEVSGTAEVEHPMRLARQLDQITRGLLALPVDRDMALAVMRRLAISSMPLQRSAVLRVLSTGEVLNTSAIARAARLDRGVARKALEDLELIGVVVGEREGGELPEGSRIDDKRPHLWRLDGEEGEICARVFQADQRAGVLWKVGTYSPTPHLGEVAQEGEGVPYFPAHPSDRLDGSAA